LEAIGRRRKQFPVLNPRASLAEVARCVRGEPQEVPCIGGYKYFYIDWNLTIWRCEAWNEPLGSVFDLDRIPDQREPCNACMMGCYRNASMLMHAAIAATDAARSLAAGQIGAAVSTLFRRSVAQSLWALVEQTPKMSRLAWRRKQTASACSGGSEASLLNPMRCLAPHLLVRNFRAVERQLLAADNRPLVRHDRWGQSAQSYDRAGRRRRIRDAEHPANCHPADMQVQPQEKTVDIIFILKLLLRHYMLSPSSQASKRAAGQTARCRRVLRPSRSRLAADAPEPGETDATLRRNPAVDLLQMQQDAVNN
jgi:YD repeat-containing protein